MSYPSNLWLYKQRLAAAGRAARLLEQDDWVLFDLETTGLGYDDKIIQIAVVDRTGRTLLDQCLDPQRPCPKESSAIHHLHDPDLVGNPTFVEFHQDLAATVAGRRWVAYNIEFDRDKMRYECGTAWPELPWFDPPHTFCAMKSFAKFYGDFSPRHGNFSWKKLVHAAEYCGVIVDAPPHSAIGDCLRTLGVLRYMADWWNRQPEEVRALCQL